MTSAQLQWLLATTKEAKASDHIFPQMAACEAALESTYGNSALAREANNLFGMKQHAHETYGTLNLPTREFLNSEWVVVASAWVKYDTVQECFADRMDTLRRLSLLAGFEHYAAALDAKDAVNYVTQVSAKWSTDPQRASKVTMIYNQFVIAPKPEGWPNE
jgi:flagellum-specific peptidoglycan hydrolase FlgJ